MPGKAHDIGVGNDGSVWVIGTNREGGGYGIYRMNKERTKWSKVAGSAVRIDVGPDGNAWVVNKGDKIFRYQGGWKVQKGAAKDIGIGANGAVWVIGTNREGGGFGIYRRAIVAAEAKWQRMGGAGSEIDADGSGLPWTVNS